MKIKSFNLGLSEEGIPVPRPSPWEYKYNKFMALFSSPKRLLNYIRFRRAKRASSVNFLPVQLDVEPVSRCNFHCTMCTVSDWPKYQRAADMSFEDFKNVLDQNYGVLELKLQGLGEPLLARDSLFEMIRYARKRHIWVRTTTNGSLLHLKDNYKKLIDSGINEIQISFDGASKETFEAIRRGSKFEKVVENCKLINKYSDEKKVLRTRMWVLLQDTNMPEFLNFVDLGAEMGFKRMTYSLHLHGWGTSHWEEVNREHEAQQMMTKELMRTAIKRGREKGLEVTFWSATDKYETTSVDKLCQWPFERVVVSSDLRIVPCCTIANPQVYDLGDARDFTKLWNSESFVEFRTAHLEGRIPEPCKMCYRQPSKKKSLNIVQSDPVASNSSAAESPNVSLNA